VAWIITDDLFFPLVANVAESCVGPERSLLYVIVAQDPRKDNLVHVSSHRILDQKVESHLIYSHKQQSHLASRTFFPLLRGFKFSSLSLTLVGQLLLGSK